MIVLLLALLAAAAAVPFEDDWTKLETRNIIREEGNWTDLEPKTARITTDICSANSVSDDSGTITSPNYPRNYPTRRNCGFLLTPPDGGTVTVTCTAFVLQRCSRPARDYLLFRSRGVMTITIGGRTFTHRGGALACGTLTSRLPLIIQTSEPLGMRFVSDSRLTYSGFSCNYARSGGDGGEEGGEGGEEGGGGSDGTCGISSNSRITGGQRAEIEEYPWMAALRLCRGNRCWFCGGSLISNRWVLTAAHCTVGASTVQVRLGGTLVNSPGLAITSTRLITHPSWSSNGLRNDIGLIQLPSPVTFTSRIRPICLPRRSLHANLNFAGLRAQISGWGRYSDNVNAISPFLRDVTVPIMSNGQCLWRPPSTQLCVNTAGGRSSCSGDSGGPLQIRQSDGSYLEVGIVSYGSASGCERGIPAGFTRVTSYLSWIQQVTGVSTA